MVKIGLQKDEMVTLYGKKLGYKWMKGLPYMVKDWVTKG